MPRRKLQHFAEMKTWPHVLEPTLFPRNQRPLTQASWGKRVILELGCGKGDYTLALAEHFSKATVVGVDIKGARMWWGAKEALTRELRNARFLRIRIEDLADYFAEGEVDEIWLPFPNPHPTSGNAKRRLTAARFLDIYRSLLKPRGLLHLKTDSRLLFDFTMDLAPQMGFARFSVPSKERALAKLQTHYEKQYRKEGRKIFYGCFRKI